MPIKKTLKKEVTKPLSDEQRALLDDSYPADNDDSNRLSLPRFGMLSKDLTKVTGAGKTKKIEVIQSAGTFYTERKTDELDENRKPIYAKDFFDGAEVEIIIAFHRKQLRKYDKGLKKFISSPIYDTADQIIPLYLDKQVIKRGTQAQLQGMYPALTQKGKPTSDLKEEYILYVIYKGELFQCGISQSSKWEFKTYKKQVGNPARVITILGSIEETSGDNDYSKMTFTVKCDIGQEEFDLVTGSQAILKEKAESDKQFFLSTSTRSEEDEEAERKFNEFGPSAETTAEAAKHF